MAGDLAKPEAPRRRRLTKMRSTQSLSDSETSSKEEMEDPFVDAPKTAIPVLSKEDGNIEDGESVAENWSFSPRGDRFEEDVSARNAQGLFAPQACVFVAK